MCVYTVTTLLRLCTRARIDCSFNFVCIYTCRRQSSQICRLVDKLFKALQNPDENPLPPKTRRPPPSYDNVMSRNAACVATAPELPRRGSVTAGPPPALPPRRGTVSVGERESRL